jgi:hypothetical protein
MLRVLLHVRERRVSISLDRNPNRLQPHHPRLVVGQLLNEALPFQVLHTQRELRTFQWETLRPSSRTPSIPLPPYQSRASFDLRRALLQGRAQLLPIKFSQTCIKDLYQFQKDSEADLVRYSHILLKILYKYKRDRRPYTPPNIDLDKRTKSGYGVTFLS